MCDYSLKALVSRPAEVGEKLITTDFGTDTVGFASINEPATENFLKTAICLLPGTEIVFHEKVEGRAGKLARFRKINLGIEHTHHDALEFVNGDTVLVNQIAAGQLATVLQLPAKPKTDPGMLRKLRLLELTGGALGSRSKV